MRVADTTGLLRRAANPRRLARSSALPLYVALWGLAAMVLLLGQWTGPLVLAWVVVLAIVWFLSPTVGAPWQRVLVTIGFVVGCVLATFEGGSTCFRPRCSVR